MSKEFGSKEFVTVGWGKKETQFHGSEGKAAAKAKVSEFRKTNSDNGLPKITWNTLSTLFAVSFIDVKANARKFKVFDRKGFLQYTSEFLDCLEGTLAWKTSDNLITSTRKLPNKYTVTFFNKNGLFHKEFTLPFNSQDVQVSILKIKISFCTSLFNTNKLNFKITFIDSRINLVKRF
jgi:elongator complex protein 1